MDNRLEDSWYHRATVRLRRGGKFKVRPIGERYDGRRLLFRRGWEISSEYRPIYAGEMAMTVENDPMPLSEDSPGCWFASGDLVDIEPVPFEQGLAEAKAARAARCGVVEAVGEPEGS